MRRVGPLSSVISSFCTLVSVAKPYLVLLACVAQGAKWCFRSGKTSNSQCQRDVEELEGVTLPFTVSCSSAT